jgi:streptogramin lyase
VLIVAAAALAFFMRGDSGGLSSVSPNSVGVIDPASNELVGEVQVGRDPRAITTGLGGVWVVNEEVQTVDRINPADLAETPFTIPLPGFPSDLTVGDGSVLVVLGALAQLVRINPEQNTAGSAFPGLGDERGSCGRPQASVAFGGGFAWFVCEIGQFGKVNVRRATSIDIGLASGLLTSEGVSISPALSDIAFGFGTVWVVDRNKQQVIPVDPLTHQGGDGTSVGRSPEAIAVGSHSLWVANFEDDTVTRILIEEGSVPQPSTIDVGDGPVDVAVGEGAVWVVNQLDGTVTRIDEESGESVATIPIGNVPQRIAADEGYVWVTVRAPEEDTLESDTPSP